MIMRILGIDPGLRCTGWGVIEASNSYDIQHIAHGQYSPKTSQHLSARLADLHRYLVKICQDYSPSHAVVEQTFVNKNPSSALHLGFARGVILMTPELCNIPVAEYSANTVKKAVTGNGHASKGYVNDMVRHILKVDVLQTDSSDALAMALCHLFHAPIKSHAMDR